MRRRIVEDSEQLELPIESAKPPLRRRLMLEEEETVTLRIDKTMAEKVVENLGAAVEALGNFVDEALYTEWSAEPPPCCGWWQVRQNNVRNESFQEWPRMWYAPSIGAWMRGVPVQTSEEARSIPHAEFAGGFRWRGLKQPWPAGYDYDLNPMAALHALVGAEAPTPSTRRRLEL